MVDRKDVFTNYINSFKKLNIDLKKKEIIYSLREMIAVFDALSLEEGIILDYVKSKEIIDLGKEDAVDDDFLEAVFVYLEISKDIIGQYVLQSIKKDIK